MFKSNSKKKKTLAYSFAGRCQVSLDGWQRDVNQGLLENLLPYCAAVIVKLLKWKAKDSIMIMSNSLDSFYCQNGVLLIVYTL